MKMPPRLIAAAWALGLLALASSRVAAQVNSDAMGLYELGAYNSAGAYLGLQSNSDTLLSLPFTRAFAYRGTIASVSGNVVTVTGSPGWTTSQFVYNPPAQTNTYYALIGANSSGPANPKEGCLYTVTANSTNTLTLNLNGDSISSVPANSQITVIPYWTLGTLFPVSAANVSFTPTTSTRSFQTQVLIPNYSGTGTNLAYSATYYYYSNGTNIGWRLFGDAITTDHSNDILIPDGYFAVRNANGAPTLPLLVVGSVATGKLTTPLACLTSGAQDNELGLTRPVNVTLNNCGLNPTNGSFVATTSTRNIQDQLYFYSNASVAFNKSPVATYFYMNSAWRLYGDAITTDHGTDVIPPGAALTLRKAATTPATTTFWTNSPGY